MNSTSGINLLLFNLATDLDDPALGFTSAWIHAFAKIATHVDVITMRAGRFNLPPNTRVFSVGKERNYSEPRRAIEFYRILTQLLRQRHYNGCFAHMMPLFALMAAPALRLKRIPIVLWYTHKAVTPTLRLASRMVNRIVTASQESFRLNRPNVRVIGHGIDAETFAPLLENTRANEQPFTILTVSRITPIKRIELVIEAFAQACKCAPEQAVCLKIVGGPATPSDHAYLDELRCQVKRLRIDQVVHFVGHTSFEKIVSTYQHADCFVTMSDTGSIDKAVLEAMSCGLPVIATPAFQGILGAELSRLWIIQPQSDLLAARIRAMLRTPFAERQQLGQALREIVIREHGLQRLCQLIINEFEARE